VWWVFSLFAKRYIQFEISIKIIVTVVKAKEYSKFQVKKITKNIKAKLKNAKN